MCTLRLEALSGQEDVPNTLGPFFILFVRCGKNTEISMQRLRFHSCLCGLEQVLSTLGKGKERKKIRLVEILCA